MKERIQSIKAQVLAYPLDNAAALESYRLTFLARKSELTDLLSQMGSVPKEERAEVGKLVNELKQLAQQRFDEAQATFANSSQRSFKATDDITLPPLLPHMGSTHPLTQLIEEIKSVFFRLGFTIAYGPELEDDFHNFTALNFPEDHPARDMQDTFFVRKDETNFQNDLVLRTHTSPVQIRLMEQQQPPIRSIMPGKVYRNEAITAKSYCLFHQIEALYVDKHVTFAELKETLIILAKMMFGNDVKYQLRPSFFPFTEPSLEMDVWWENKATGKAQWLEILGAGMVDPNVLKAVNIDPEVYSGFALGLGVERTAMRKYGVADIRTFYDNDYRFLQQFV